MYVCIYSILEYLAEALGYCKSVFASCISFSESLWMAFNISEWVNYQWGSNAVRSHLKAKNKIVTTFSLIGCCLLHIHPTSSLGWLIFYMKLKIDISEIGYNNYWLDKSEKNM